MWLIVLVAGGVFFYGLVVWTKAVGRQRRLAARLAALTAKYGDAEIASRIMHRKIWQDMTEEMVRDSWGLPQAVDVKVLKTKHKEVWKYGQSGKNRFDQKVIIENGLVVGWESK